ncbi:alpha/beta hydrolase [Amycolatopsis sp. cmx-11-12]|uniref:alpha/beta hydrolase n=1 Tax=Amycolatopsis sp. cmx-11-12 TaxID=2785795 RepID=UPI0039181115
MYDKDNWPDLNTALENVKNGDANGIFTLADSYTNRKKNGDYLNTNEAFAVITTADKNIDWDGPDPGPSELKYDPPAGTPKIVTIGATGDIATQYKDAQTFTRQLGHAVLVTVQDRKHTTYPKGSTTKGCLDRTVNDYLTDLQVPVSPGDVNPVC